MAPGGTRDGERHLDMQVPLTFGQALKEYRLATGMTQEALAARAGVSPRNVQNLERGVNQPQRETAERLAEALGLGGADRAAFLAAAQPRPRRRSPKLGARSGAGFLLLPGELPFPLAPLVGREREATDLDALLGRADLRVLTLAGPGGVGKTRLALHVAHRARERFLHGVTFVDLAPLRDSGLVLPAIARALGLMAQGRRPAAEVVAAHLRDRQLLLLLDNCEHVLDAVEEMAALWTACHGLHVLATSRMALRVRGEQVYPVPPLTTPTAAGLSSVEELQQVPSVALFVQQARAALPSFTLTPANVSAVAAICIRLDGLPLAIELAAVRVAELPPATLAARLDRTLDVLVEGPRDAHPHQRSLRDTIAWTENLLPPPVQAMFRRLSPFAGGCTVEAARAVCGNCDVDVPEGLATLAAAHLLHVDAERGEPRYAMLATIREFVLERLDTTGERAEARVRHADYYIGLAEEVATDFDGPNLPRALDTLEVDLQNLREALAWCIEQGKAGDQAAAERGLSVAASLFAFWSLRPHLREGDQWLTRLLHTAGGSGPTPARVRALSIAALTTVLGDVSTMHTRAAEAVRLAETSDDLVARAYAFGLAAPAAAVVAPSDTRDHARTRDRIQEALELYRAAGRGEGWEMLLSMNFLVMASLWMGDIARAETDLARMIALSEDRGNRWTAGVAHDLLGGIAWSRGEIARAQECYQRHLLAMGPVGDTQTIAHAHYLIGRLAEEDGDLGSARMSYAHALALVCEVGDFALIERGGAAIAIMAAVATQQPVPPQARAHAAAAFGLLEAGGKPLMLEQVLTKALQGAEATSGREPCMPGHRGLD